MPFAVGRDREAGIGAGHHRHAGLVGLGEVAAGALVLALHMADAALDRRRLVRLGEVDDVALEGERGRDRRAALEHRVDAFVVEVEGVEDQIDAGARGVEHRLAADRVDHRLAAEPLDLAHHGGGLLLGERGDQVSVGAALDAVERDLDAVDAVLGLDADLLDRLVPAGHQPADRGRRRADPARIPVGQALACRDVGPGGADARPVEQAGADRVADRQADLAGIARRADRGVAGRQQLLGEEQAAQRAELQRAVEVDILLALGIAIGEMDVDVDQARHDELPGIVEHRLARAAALGACSVGPTNSRTPRASYTRVCPGLASGSPAANSVPQRTCVLHGCPLGLPRNSSRAGRVRIARQDDLACDHSSPYSPGNRPFRIAAIGSAAWKDETLSEQSSRSASQRRRRYPGPRGPSPFLKGEQR